MSDLWDGFGRPEGQKNVERSSWGVPLWTAAGTLAVILLIAGVENRIGQPKQVPCDCPTVPVAVTHTAPVPSEEPVNPALALATHLTRKYEGLRLKAYHDEAGYPTQGYGHRLSAEKHADLSQFPPITIHQAESLLWQDMDAVYDDINRLVHEPLTVGQLAALLDWTFNLGEGNLERSTLLRRLNGGEKDSVPHEILRWDYIGDHRSVGLMHRREDEVKLWNGTY